MDFFEVFCCNFNSFRPPRLNLSTTKFLKLSTGGVEDDFPKKTSTAMGFIDEFSKKNKSQQQIPQIHSSTAFPSTQKKQRYKLQYQDGSEPNFGGNPQQTQIFSPFFWDWGTVGVHFFVLLVVVL